MKVFARADLARLRHEPEVGIEPAAQDREPTAKPIIWVVTDHGGVFVRSYLGARGRWYQRMRKDTRATLPVGRQPIFVRARAGSGTALNQRVDDAYFHKYGGPTRPRRCSSPTCAGPRCGWYLPRHTEERHRAGTLPSGCAAHR